MDEYFVVGIIAIPYHRFGVIVKLISKNDISYRLTIGNISQFMCLNFAKMSSHALGEKENGCTSKTFTMC